MDCAWRSAVAIVLLVSSAATASCPESTDAAPPNANRFSILVAGEHAGLEQAWNDSDGALRRRLSFRIEDQTPELDVCLKLNGRGVPVLLRATGQSYITGSRLSVNEHFELSRGRVKWQNVLERQERVANGDAFYLTVPLVPVQIAGDPEELAVLARALLARRGGIPLLPDGEATIKRLKSLEVVSHGKSKHITQYAIFGLSLAPTPIWLEQDGSLFALINEGVSVIQEAWESADQQLKRAQAVAQEQRNQRLATALVHRPVGPLVIQHANLFDAETATTRPNMTVVVAGNHITEVGADEQIHVRGKAEFLDATGETLLPGLWDMHTHIGPSDGVVALAAGVTTVRDMGNFVERVTQIKKGIDSGQALGPRVILAGIVDGSGPYHEPASLTVDTVQQAREAIDTYAAAGYKQVKPYRSLKPAVVPTIVQYSHLRGMRVGGHVPAFMTADEVVRDGFDEIVHIGYLFWNFMDDVDTSRPERQAAFGERASTLDLTSERVRTLINLLKDHDVAVDATLETYETRFTARPGVISQTFAPYEHHLPLRMERFAMAGGLPVPPGEDEQYRNGFHAALQMVGQLHAAGVPVIAGSDGWVLFSYQRELELDVAAGIPTAAVLQSATLGAARLMQRDGDLGSIKPGKLADLVLIRGNPTLEMRDIRNVEMVIKDGAVVSGRALRQAIALDL